MTDARKKRDIFRLHDQGKDNASIAKITGVPYPLVYYYLKSRGHIENVLNRKKAKELRFDYKEYVDTLFLRCGKFRGCSVEEMKDYSKTEEGSNFLLRIASQYTPSVHLLLKTEKEETIKRNGR